MVIGHAIARGMSLMVQVRKDTSGERTEMQKMVAWVRCGVSAVKLGVVRRCRRVKGRG